MKIANVKAMMVKGIMTVVAAGALIAVAPAKAEAQGFAVGVQFGRPAPVIVEPYRGYDRYAFERREEFLRREAFLRHEEWLRAHRGFDRPYGYR